MTINPSASPNVIVGCAFNYTDADILPFLRSLEQCGYRGDLLLLTNDRSHIHLSGYSFHGMVCNVDATFGEGATTHPANTYDPATGSTPPADQHLHERAMQQLENGENLDRELVAFFYRKYFMMTARYFLYYYYLFDTRYTTVLLTDVNDVIFQQDPFLAGYENGVTAFAENGAISIMDEPTNHFWIQEAFGDAVLQSMGNEVVYCAGTVMIQNGVQRFLKDFLTVVLQHHISTVVQGIDQGVFNYLISYRKLPYFHCQPNNEVVLTVANVPAGELATTPDGIRLAKSPHLPPVVHQYTRFGHLAAYATEKYH